MDELPGFSFWHSAYPTIVALLLFGASVGAALVVLVQEWQQRRERCEVNDAVDELMRIGFLEAEQRRWIPKEWK